MQQLASEFSKIFLGRSPGPLQREGATPSCTQHSARPLTERGRKRPGVGTQTMVPLNFSAVVALLSVTTLVSLVWLLLNVIFLD